jgi:tetratricopeptide (TPR) repeat protein
MMRPSFLSRFTPSLMAPEVLEEIFVQRESLAARLVRQVRESVLGEEKHQRLIVGPRGIGKTHLVSLVYHRVRAMDDLRDRMRIAWLREEEWGISSFLDLLLRILVALDVDDPEAGLRSRLETVYALEGGAAEAAAVALLGEVLAGRTLLLIVENLDEVFAGLGEPGQQRFRAYLQNRRECTILATSPALFGAVWLEKSPFYGFFQVTHLKEFDVDAARALLLNLARLTSNEELARLLASPVGRNRLQALHHLVGGNPRLYVILAQFLTRESLDDLVDAFLNAIDQLTPYYRERMQLLPPLQQKLVFLLSEAGAPVSVKVLAERSFATQQTVSSQLKQLRSARFVVAHPVGRESWYELREPLLRLVLRVKKEHGEPIRLFVDFLRVWYSQNELAQRLATLPPFSTEAGYVQQALALTETGESDALRALLKARGQAVTAYEWERALELNDRLRELRDAPGDWGLWGILLGALGRIDEALKVFDEAVQRAPDNAVIAAARARVMALAGRLEDAQQSLESITLRAQPSPQLLGARGMAWLAARRPERALEDYRALSELHPEETRGYVGQGTALLELGRTAEAIELLDPLVNQLQDDHRYLDIYARALTAAGRWEAADQVYGRLTILGSMNQRLWMGLALVRNQLGKYADALEALDHVPAADPLYAVYYFLRGHALSGLDRREEALESFDRAVDHADSPELGAEYELYATSILVSLGRWPDVVGRLARGLTRTKPRNEVRLQLVAIAVAALGHQPERLWSEGVNELLAHCGDSSDQLAFGTSLLASIQLLLTNEGVAHARRWLDAWAQASQRIPEIHLGYRLADVAVRYREQPDERLLLALPMEERKVVTALLEIPEVEPT